jgi:hypothetical protein
MFLAVHKLSSVIKDADQVAAFPTEERRAKNRERVRRQRANWSPEKKAEEQIASRKRMAKHYASMTAEKRAKKIAAINEARRRRVAPRRAAAAAAAVAAKAQRIAAVEAAAAAAEAMRVAGIKQRRTENRQAFNADARGLCARIKAAIPRSFPADIRDDVASDMSIALMDGEIALNEIESKARHFISLHYKAREWHTALSLDAVTAGTDDLRAIDRLTYENIVW